MVGELAVKFHRMLRDRQQPLLLRGHGHAGGGMGVDDKAQIVPGGMDRGMDGEAGLVDDFRTLRILKRLAIMRQAKASKWKAPRGVAS